jgi:hypothetical protein
MIMVMIIGSWDLNSAIPCQNLAYSVFDHPIADSLQIGKLVTVKAGYKISPLDFRIKKGRATDPAFFILSRDICLWNLFRIY